MRRPLRVAATAGLGLVLAGLAILLVIVVLTTAWTLAAPIARRLGRLESASLALGAGDLSAVHFVGPVGETQCAEPGVHAGQREVVADAALTIDPEDIPDITRALTTLATDPALAATLRAKGLTNAARFHWSHTARQVADVYEKAAG